MTTLDAVAERIEIGLARSVTADNTNYMAVSLTIAECHTLLDALASRRALIEALLATKARIDAIGIPRDSWQETLAQIRRAITPSAVQP